jgi:hypothetical protein
MGRSPESRLLPSAIDEMPFSVKIALEIERRFSN